MTLAAVSVTVAAGQEDYFGAASEEAAEADRRLLEAAATADFSEHGVEATVSSAGAYIAVATIVISCERAQAGIEIITDSYYSESVASAYTAHSLVESIGYSYV